MKREGKEIALIKKYRVSLFVRDARTRGTHGFDKKGHTVRLPEHKRPPGWTTSWTV